MQYMNQGMPQQMQQQQGMPQLTTAPQMQQQGMPATNQQGLSQKGAGMLPPQQQRISYPGGTPGFYDNQGGITSIGQIGDGLTPRGGGFVPNPREGIMPVNDGPGSMGRPPAPILGGNDFLPKPSFGMPQPVQPPQRPVSKPYMPTIQPLQDFNRPPMLSDGGNQFRGNFGRPPQQVGGGFMPQPPMFGGGGYGGGYGGGFGRPPMFGGGGFGGNFGGGGNPFRRPPMFGGGNQFGGGYGRPPQFGGGGGFIRPPMYGGGFGGGFGGGNRFGGGNQFGGGYGGGFGGGRPPMFGGGFPGMGGGFRGGFPGMGGGMGGGFRGNPFGGRFGGGRGRFGGGRNPFQGGGLGGMFPGMGGGNFRGGRRDQPQPHNSGMIRNFGPDNIGGRPQLSMYDRLQGQQQLRPAIATRGPANTMQSMFAR